jgi:hypothetical protein
VTEHVVQQGECLNSIAAAYGLLWQTIWNFPRNAALKHKRKDPNILFPGDLLYIHDKTPRLQSCATDRRHSFRLQAQPCKLRVMLLYNDKPRAGEPYSLIVDGVFFDGKADADGWVEREIPPGAVQGRLVLKNAGEVHLLLLGEMDPIAEIAGIQKRLQNLGYYIGEKADGIFGPKTASGVRVFQRQYGLVVDGIPGPKTQAKLKEVYGC